MARHRCTTRVLAMSVLVMQANATISTERETRFDTDSELVGIDNRCSACISHESSDFDGPLEKSNRVVKGFGGSRTTNIKVGILKWSWEDNQGVVTTFRIPNLYSSTTYQRGRSDCSARNIGHKRRRRQETNLELVGAANTPTGTDAFLNGTTAQVGRLYRWGRETTSLHSRWRPDIQTSRRSAVRPT
jgi:hypothetical protein